MLDCVPMKARSALITGSCGLIGSEVSGYFARNGYQVYGVDNNERAVFFGPEGDTSWTLERLCDTIPGYTHFRIDIRDRSSVLKVVAAIRPDVIVHTAAQPSHDRAAAIPFDDFETNAVGTLNLLEAARRSCPESPFVHMSTNKVYGDLPNSIRLRELETRWDYDDETFSNGIPESFSVDQSKHSLFGASKLAGDVMVQEYGRYFGMKTACFRGGCLTGPNHSGTKLHGFLAYLMRCAALGQEYTVYGYRGKQVRDNIHCFDLINCFHEFYRNPRSGEVYNMGGGRFSNASMQEAIKMCEEITGREMKSTYTDENRIGDHIWWISDTDKFKSHYPGWKQKYDVPGILKDIYEKNVERWRAESA